jgi:halocin C8-like bacteriocin domain-containing protein
MTPSSLGYEIGYEVNEARDSYKVDMTKFSVVDGTVREEHENNSYTLPENKPSQDKGGDSTTQAITTQASNVCEFCKTIGNIICTTGCGVAASAVCGILLVTTVGGIACGAILSVICGAIYASSEITLGYACDLDQAGEYLCEQTGYCN